MSDRGAGDHLAAGGPVRHHPVLRAEAIAALAVRSGGLYVDGTFGAGGYTSAILTTPGARVVALDRDPTAIASGLASGYDDSRLTLVEARFGSLDAVVEQLSLPPLDGVVLDIGVSSMQFDEAERGFSFRFDGPLDMRMSREGRSAADIVNGAGEEELADILYHYGEERASRRIARAIALDRKSKPFTSTRALAEMIARIMPGKPGDIHPATRSFQALRIAVNDELGELHDALEAAERRLAPAAPCGGDVPFAGGPDRQTVLPRPVRSRRCRVAPHARRDQPPCPDFPVHRQATCGPGAQEIAANPRARSAKLRFGRRTEAPARAPDARTRASVVLPPRTGA